MAELVEVTQEDREAAIAIAAEVKGFHDAEWTDNVRFGRLDNDEIVQAFARHRIATRPPASGVAEELAEIKASMAYRHSLIGRTTEALEAADYLIERLRLCHGGKVVRDLEEANSAYDCARAHLRGEQP